MQTTKYLKRKRNSSTRYFMGFMSLCFILIFSIILHTCYFNEPVKALEVYNEKTTENENQASNIKFADGFKEDNSLYNYLDLKPYQLSSIIITQNYLSDTQILNIQTMDMKKVSTDNEESETKKIEETVQKQPQEPSQIQEELTEENKVSENPEYTILKTYDVPAGHSFKSYTNYKLLSKPSKQGQLQQQAYTGETGIRMVDDYYCAALGTYYDGNIGDKFLVTLSSGKQFKMILCDVKADHHTDAKHQYTKVNGCVIEFYVDYGVLSSYVKRMGNISYIDGFEGEITCIQKIQG